MLGIFTIVLDGMPFLAWQWPALCQLDIPWKWVIAEGASSNSGSTSWCKPQAPRLSRDGTNELLAAFRSHPRITVLQRQLWESKDAMVNACLEEFRKPCTLLQMDVDEFWPLKQMQRLPTLFEIHPASSVAEFCCRYWVGPNLVIDIASDKSNRWTRLWKFSPGQKFRSHEPPILIGSESAVVSNAMTMEHGFVFDHFAYVFQRQVAFKEKFYGYKNALACWHRLQRNETWPARLKNFLPWANPESIVERLYT